MPIHTTHEEMPEQAQPVEAGGDERIQPAHRDLAGQEDDPEQADADVSAVGADQREEGGEKTAARRAGAGEGHAVEFRNLHGDEAESEQERHAEPGLCAPALPGCDRNTGEAEGRAACEQQYGLREGAREPEQRVAAGPVRGVVRDHDKGRQQQGEDDRVAHQADPEAICLLVDGAFGYFGFGFIGDRR